MLRLPVTALGVSLVASVMGCHGLPAVSATERAESVLPLRSVRLYENGVGYFEREGLLAEHGAALGVPASHVDDALKTLLILSSGGAKVSAIEFSSVVSDGAARSLAGLPLEGDTPVDYAHLLASLKGFRVELMGAKGLIVRGRLLDVALVEGKPATAAKDGVATPAQPPDFSLLVVSENGGLVRARASDVERIQPLDKEFSARLQTAADALGGRAAQLNRDLRVLATSNAPVRIGYIAETPVWRSSYRLILPREGKQAALQGWALVHNDTDEPWQNVAVELVNGTPDSFLFPLAAPRYARRSLLTPETELSTVPQLATRTADGLWGDHVEDASGEGGLGLSGEGEGGGGTGEGIGLGSIGTVGHGSGSGSLGGSHTGTSASSNIEIGDLAAVAKAKPKDEGRLFSYRLAEPVSLRAHGSALLPLLQNATAARRLTRFHDGTARATVRFQNDTPYILPTGPLAVFEPDGFAGEAIIDRLLPGSRTFLEYGVDLDVALTESRKDISRTPQHVQWNARQRNLQEDYVEVSERALSVTNHGKTTRSVAYVLSSVVQNAKVEGADELDYDDAASEALDIIDVPGTRSVLRTLRITEAKATSHRLANLKADDVDRLIAAPTLPAADRAVLRAARPHVVAMRAARSHADEIAHHQSELESDLTRNREHLEAAHNGEGNANPIATRIVQLERALDSDKKEFARADAAADDLLQKAAAAFAGLTPNPPSAS
jgi:hypothetical protein